jgi:hypothetical protein
MISFVFFGKPVPTVFCTYFGLLFNLGLTLVAFEPFWSSLLFGSGSKELLLFHQVILLVIRKGEKSVIIVTIAE